jgi:hypothetical protein
MSGYGANSTGGSPPGAGSSTTGTATGTSLTPGRGLGG